MLNPQPLPLTPDRTPQIAQLVLDRVIDGFVCFAQVLSHVVAYLVARDALPQLLARVTSPCGAAGAKTGCSRTCPPRAKRGAAEHR